MKCTECKVEMEVSVFDETEYHICSSCGELIEQAAVNFDKASSDDKRMEWFSPWWSTEKMDERFHETFRAQLELEVCPEHQLYGLPTKLLARGSGDDALFLIMDGSERVANVHLTWSKRKERLPWPVTTIYENIDTWAEQVMAKEHIAIFGTH